MRWYKLLTALLVAVAGFVAVLIVVNPGYPYTDALRGIAVAFIVVSVVCLVVPLGRPEPSIWTPERQLEYARQIVAEDARWMAHNPLVVELTERVLALLSPNWYRTSFESPGSFRKRLGLDPHEPRAVLANESDATFMRWLGDRLVHVYGENKAVDFVLATYRIADKLAQEPSALLAPVREMTVDRMHEQAQHDEATHNAALSMVVEAIRETDSRDAAIARIEGLRR